MLAVILSWMLLFFIFLSFGSIATIVLHKLTKWDNHFSMTDRIWLGICFVANLLLIISIFAPLNIWVLVGLIAIAVAHTIWDSILIKSYMPLAKEAFQRFSIYHITLFFLVFLIILIYSLSTPLIYDEGLYHLQSMQWSEKFGTIIGLGNIHGRFGFNSSFLLLSTVFNYHPSHFTPIFTLNSFCLLVFSLSLVNQITKTKNIIQTTFLYAVLLISLFSLAPNISSTSTDILPNILVLYILIKWSINKEYIQESPLVIIIVSIFCITLKLSSAIILLAPLFILINLWREKRRTTVSFICILGSIIIVPWLIRFVLLTGYLVYPFPAVDLFDVDWKMPIELVIEEKDLAYAWARVPFMKASDVLAMSFTQWFPLWIKNLSLYNLLLNSLAIVSPIVILVLAYAKRFESKHVYIPWSIALVGVLFSLLTAPDFRFAFGYIVCAGFIPFLNIRMGYKINMSLLRLSVRSATIVVLLWISTIAYLQLNTYHSLSSNAKTKLLLEPQSITLLKNNIENFDFAEQKLNNTTIFIPQHSNQCFDQPIPCAPHHVLNLEMRGNTIKDGFKIKK